jgi:hypothetical protein
MKLCFTCVLEIWFVTTLLRRMVSGPGKLLRPGTGARSLPGGHFAMVATRVGYEVVIDDGVIGFSFPRFVAKKL